MGFDHGEKFTHQALVVALKGKFPDFSLFFLTISIFKTFLRSGKLVGKFQDFFKNSRLCRNPVNGKLIA